MSFSIEKHILEFSAGGCCKWCQSVDDIPLHLDDWGCFDREVEIEIVEKEKKVRVNLQEMGLGDCDKIGSILEEMLCSKPKISNH